MSAVRPPMVDASPSALHWGSRGLRFELRSSSPAVIRHAERVFRPWRTGSAVGALGTWEVEQAGRADAWEVRRHSTEGSHLVETRSSAARAVTCVEFLAARALFDGTPTTLAFHAALVTDTDRSVLICGPSGSGKSTLACALWQRGWSLLTDDTAVVDEATLVAGGAPRRVSLRSPSRDLVGEDLWARILGAPAGEQTDEGCLFHPDEIDDRPSVRQARLGACVFLARRGAPQPSPASVAPISPAHAALALLPYANLARHLDPGRALARLVPIATAIPAFDLVRGPLPAMVEAVARLLEAR